MKNTKAVLLIVLGSFIIATGFAFAETEQVALGQLKELQKSIVMPVVSAPSQNITRETATTTAPAATTVAPAVPTPAAVAAPAEPKPTLGQKIKTFIGDNLSQIVSAAVIGVLGFLVLGTGGAGLLVGLAAFAFFSLLKHL